MEKKCFNSSWLPKHLLKSVFKGWFGWNKKLIFVIVVEICILLILALVGIILKEKSLLSNSLNFNYKIFTNC